MSMRLDFFVILQYESNNINYSLVLDDA